MESKWKGEMERGYEKLEKSRWRVNGKGKWKVGKNVCLIKPNNVQDVLGTFNRHIRKKKKVLSLKQKCLEFV